ncbi:DNase I-like protein [Basidiobolus meristosporus CBS 931.73]|uniref:DNase I-like protein n=1 Tax=Basidiobolus meristosporus CBS 931.73 TaxID=1314790 RepID=A0A1Y1Y9Z6_9FUNG|nr:DNase I-like protein [Basidiobolus meristosporus CBS 931.73]|eukprot:ORX94414.1 DNase I-like protein [Basidiobolus meristosporus CBS 931.73]
MTKHIPVSSEPYATYTSKYQAPYASRGNFNRTWLHLDTPNEPEEEFTIISYNILADYLAFKNRHLYSYCPNSVLTWANRGRKILKEIQAYKADIYCLQECEKRHFHCDFAPALRRLGYRYVYKQRTGEDMWDGCAVLYNTKRFELVKHCTVEYNSDDFMDRNNVGIIVVLRDLKTNRKLCVANTHILFNTKRGILKIAQLQKLLLSAYEIISSQPMPLVICGDFNSTPHSLVYRYINDGVVDLSSMDEIFMSGQVEPFVPLHAQPKRAYNAETIHAFNATQARFPEDDSVNRCILKHPYKFHSGYEHPMPSEEFTTLHDDAKLICDYIFFGGLTEQLRDSLLCTRQLSLPKIIDCTIPGIPAKDVPSDHLPLALAFSWTS